MDTDSPPAVAKPSRTRVVRVALSLLGVLGRLLLVLLSLVLGLLVFVLAPPSDLLRRAALPLARASLNHDDLEIGALRLTPLRGLEIVGLRLGPPKGYRRPLATVRRLVVDYDLSGILSGVVRVRKVQIERPVVHAVARKGKLGWLAFLEGMPKSEPKPEEPEQPSEPAAIKVHIERVSLVGLGAFFDDGAQRLALDSLHLAVDGLYSPTSSHAHLALRVEGRRQGKDALLVVLRGKQPLTARLNTRLSLDLRLGNLLQPRGRAKLALHLATSKLVTPQKLRPLALDLGLDANFDLAKQKAGVKGLTLKFNKNSILDLGATLEGLTDPKAVALHLRRLNLPLDELEPYARAFVKGVRFGGTVRLSDLRMTSKVATLKDNKIPKFSGMLETKGVWADLTLPKTPKTTVRGLDISLDVSGRGPGAAVPAKAADLLAGLPPLPGASGDEARLTSSPLAISGTVKLGRFSGYGATLRDLKLGLSGGTVLKRFAPGLFATKLRLDIPSLNYHIPGKGTLPMVVHFAVDAAGDLTTEEARVSLLSLDLPGLFDLRANASVKRWGKKALSARLTVPPVDLARLLKKLPRGLTAALGKARLSGKVGLDVGVTGRLPTSWSAPLRVPLSLDAKVSLAGLKYVDPKQKLEANGLTGPITLKGRADDLTLTTGLKLRRLIKKDQFLEVRDIELPLTLRLRPKRVSIKLPFALASAHKGDIGLGAQKVSLDLTADASLAVERLIAGGRASLGKTSLQLKHKLGSLEMKVPGSTLLMDGEQTQLDLAYSPKGGGATTMKLNHQMARFRQPEQGLEVRGFKVTFDDRVTGHGSVRLPDGKVGLDNLSSTHRARAEVGSVTLGAQGITVNNLGMALDGQAAGFSVPKKGRPTLKRGDTRLEVTVGSLAMARVLAHPLRRSRIHLDLSMDHLTDLTVRQLDFRVPTGGIYVEGKGYVKGLMGYKPPKLPDFSLDLAAGIQNPRAEEEGKATVVHTGLRSAGRFGLKLAARRLSPTRVKLDGALTADDFCLWSSGQNGRTVIRDIDANLPISQEIIFQLPRWTLPRPKRVIAASSGSGSPIYEALRPYTTRGAGFSMAELLLEKKTARGVQRLSIKPLKLDLSLADNALDLRRTYVKVLDGDLAGAVQAQVLSLVPFDPVLRFKTQVTGVNLGLLDPERETVDETTEVSALIDLRARPAREEVSGRVNITRLSLEMLDSLLAYLDPDRGNVSVQNNRKLLNAWYTRWINPRVRLVSIWINHGNLNMDIEMEAWFVVGTVLKRVLKNMRIRRLNILPMVRQSVTPTVERIGRQLRRAGAIEYKE